MAQSKKALRTQALPVLSRLDKKLRRKARHEARKSRADFEAPINESCASGGRVARRKLHTQIEGLYRQAVLDMDKRLHTKGKARRELNDSVFGREVRPTEGYHDITPKRRAAGSDKSASINKALRAKRG